MGATWPPGRVESVRATVCSICYSITTHNFSSSSRYHHYQCPYPLQTYMWGGTACIFVCRSNLQLVPWSTLAFCLERRWCVGRRRWLTTLVPKMVTMSKQPHTFRDNFPSNNVQAPHPTSFWNTDGTFNRDDVNTYVSRCNDASCPIYRFVYEEYIRENALHE